jgi:hypothetical protein
LDFLICLIKKKNQRKEGFSRVLRFPLPIRLLYLDFSASLKLPSWFLFVFPLTFQQKCLLNLDISFRLLLVARARKYVLIEPLLNLLNHIVPLLKLRIQSVKLSVILDKVITPEAFKISEFWVKSEISASLG